MTAEDVGTQLNIDGIGSTTVVANWQRCLLAIAGRDPQSPAV